MVGPELSNTINSLSAVAAIVGSPGTMSALLHVLDDNAGSGGLHLADLVGLGVVAESASVGHSLHHLWLKIILIKKLK